STNTSSIMPDNSELSSTLSFGDTLPVAVTVTARSMRLAGAVLYSMLVSGWYPSHHHSPPATASNSSAASSQRSFGLTVACSNPSCRACSCCSLFTRVTCCIKTQGRQRQALPAASHTAVQLHPAAQNIAVVTQ